MLGCDVVERDFGLTHPALLVRFPDGSAFSVESTNLAPADLPGHALDDEHAFRGAWIGFRTTDIDGVHAALRQAGTPGFPHPGSTHVCFRAPGGQVFRVLDASR